MEIVSANEGLLLDLDAYRLLKERARQRKGAGGGSKGKGQGGDARLQKSLARHRDWVERECLRHLQEQPAGQEQPGEVKAFLSALRAFSRQRGPQAELTRAETMQLVNLRPTAPVEVHLVVEECAERLTDEDVDALCALVARHLGGPQGEDGSGGGGSGSGEGTEVSTDDAAAAAGGGKG